MNKEIYFGGMYGGLGGQKGPLRSQMFDLTPQDTASDKNFNQQKYKSIGHVIEQ